MFTNKTATELCLNNKELYDMHHTLNSKTDYKKCLTEAWLTLKSKNKC